MERYFKDKKLEGIYVKRCKCGARPYHDRIEGISQWIACNCGRIGISEVDFLKCIENWNNNKITRYK